MVIAAGIQAHNPRPAKLSFMLAVRKLSFMLSDRLNWNLEPHPQWIHKAPGTFGSHFERNMFYSPPLPSKACAWDSRSHLANCLSGDPVTDGLRRGLNNRRGTTTSNLSPTRPFLER